MLLNLTREGAPSIGPVPNTVTFPRSRNNYRGGTSEVSIFLVKNPSLTTESANQNPIRAELFLLPSRPLPVEVMAR